MAMLVLAACAEDGTERRFEWTGMQFHAGAELNYFITPLDETKATGDPKTIEVGNDGNSLLAYSFAGQLVPGRIYYFVDGNEDGKCDDYSDADLTGYKEFPASELTTNITYNYDAGDPEGVCRWFPDSVIVTQPTATPTQAEPDASESSGPDWVSLNRRLIVEAFGRYIRAWDAANADGVAAASTYQSADHE
jgi:hypothetical protein